MTIFPHPPPVPLPEPDLDSAATSLPASNLPIVSPKEPSAGRSWVPIRSLGPRHRQRIINHLVTLNLSDRYLRFGYGATDAQLSQYVDRMDFEHDEVFGIFNRRLELIAMAHLAHPTAPTPPLSPPSTATMSEFGVSVLPDARGRGFGRRLFEHSMVHARNRGIDTLFIHALSENTAMLKIARYAGATIERNGSESEARLKLPPDTFSSHVGEMVEQQAAELDYRLKVRSRQVSGILDAFADVKTAMSKATHIAEE